MKININIGLLVSVLLILLLTFFFNVATLVDISKATSSESVIYSALLDAGYYNGVKLIILGYVIYVVTKRLWDDISRVREHNDISDLCKEEAQGNGLSKASDDDIDKQDTAKEVFNVVAKVNGIVFDKVIKDKE